MLADALAADDRIEEAATEYETLFRADELPRETMVSAGRAALTGGRLQLASDLLHAAQRAGVVEGVGGLRADIERQLGERGVVRLVRTGGQMAAAETPLERDRPATFSDIGGLDDVKKIVHRTIILPFQRADLYASYGRRSGGGVLLYGPPGVGKTLIARATAGECRLPFHNIRIEDIVDPWYGNAELNLHSAFEQARATSPCVLFIDEIDAIGHARSKQLGAGRQLVDQLLQELDAIGVDNREILILASTNTPWDVDDALKRPGRFDRVLFVPPPDEQARRAILELVLRDRPAEQIDVPRIARLTPLFSGADLRALVERAVDFAIDEALDQGRNVPITMDHFARALQRARPSTISWLSTARTYVMFGNVDHRFDDVREFLESDEAKQAKP
jgi:transitional endoplasmic reticulum ATPase